MNLCRVLGNLSRFRNYHKLPFLPETSVLLCRWFQLADFHEPGCAGRIKDA